VKHGKSTEAHVCQNNVHVGLQTHITLPTTQQDHQALLKAKHCPRVAAVSRTPTNPCDLELWPMTLKFCRVLEVVELRVCTKMHQAKCSGSRVIVRTSLFALSHNGEKSVNPVLWPWPLTLKLSGCWAIVKIHVPAKFHQGKCSGSWVIHTTGTQFTYSEEMEGWVDLGGWLYTETVYLSADSHNNNNNNI